MGKPISSEDGNNWILFFNGMDLESIPFPPRHDSIYSLPRLNYIVIAEKIPFIRLSYFNNKIRSFGAKQT